MKVLPAIIVALVTFVVASLLGAFIAWQINPEHWDPFGRFAVGLSSLFAGIITLGVTNEPQ